jgi:hypothetical protein
MGSGWRGGPVLAAWPSERVLAEIDGDRRTSALVVLTWSPNDVAGWVAVHDPDVLSPGVVAPEAAALSDPVVVLGIDSLMMLVNQSNNLAGTFDRNLAVAVLLMLHDGGQRLDRGRPLRARPQQGLAGARCGAAEGTRGRHRRWQAAAHPRGLAAAARPAATVARRQRLRAATSRGCYALTASSAARAARRLAHSPALRPCSPASLRNTATVTSNTEVTPVGTSMSPSAPRRSAPRRPGAGRQGCRGRSGVGDPRDAVPQEVPRPAAMTGRTHLPLIGRGGCDHLQVPHHPGFDRDPHPARGLVVPGQRRRARSTSSPSWWWPSPLCRGRFYATSTSQCPGSRSAAPSHAVAKPSPPAPPAPVLELAAGHATARPRRGGGGRGGMPRRQGGVLCRACPSRALSLPVPVGTISGLVGKPPDADGKRRFA